MKPSGGSAVTSISSTADSNGIMLASNVLSAPADATITAKIMPNRGYQLLSTTAGSIELTPDDDDANIGYYTFAMPKADTTFSCTFTKTDDAAEIDSDAVVSATISDADAAVTNGTLELDITDLDDSSDIKALTDQASKLGSSSSNVVATVDMSLYNIVNQGDEDMTWDSDITSLSSAITLTLKLSDKAASGASQFYIIREHDNAFQQATVTYDSSAKTITFKSNAFSSYAIVKGAPSSSSSTSSSTTTSNTSSSTSNSSGSSTPKTGDTNDVVPIALVTVVSAGVAVVAVRRLREE